MVIAAIKDLPPWRFVLLWVWLVVMALTPLGWIVGLLLAWKAK
ncbi:hypothetical protein [Pseudothauera rhizosphaerae]|nr:hypothetical protein [Pseudothauera rhizosphaerae]